MAKLLTLTLVAADEQVLSHYRSFEAPVLTAPCHKSPVPPVLAPKEPIPKLFFEPKRHVSDLIFNRNLFKINGTLMEIGRFGLRKGHELRRGGEISTGRQAFRGHGRCQRPPHGGALPIPRLYKP